jgi:hypothetical protein
MTLDAIGPSQRYQSRQEHAAMTAEGTGIKIIDGSIHGCFAIDKQQACLPSRVPGLETPEADHLCGDIISTDGVQAGLVAPGEWIIVHMPHAIVEVASEAVADPHYLTIDYTFGTELAECTKEFALTMFRMHSTLDIQAVVDGPSRVGRTRLADTTIVFFWISAADKMLIVFDYAEREVFRLLIAEASGRM